MTVVVEWLILVCFRVIVVDYYLEWLWSNYLWYGYFIFCCNFLTIIFWNCKVKMVLRWNGLIVIFILSRTVDFSRVFENCLVVKICVFRCYFIIIYWIFGGVRWNAYFSRAWEDFLCYSCDFWWCGKLWNSWF